MIVTGAYVRLILMNMAHNMTLFDDLFHAWIAVQKMFRSLNLFLDINIWFAVQIGDRASKIDTALYDLYLQAGRINGMALERSSNILC